VSRAPILPTSARFRGLTTTSTLRSPHRHQIEAIRVAASGAKYVLTSGTGSGKSLAYIVPIVNEVLRLGPGNGIKAIVVYRGRHGEYFR
jgi:Lhr-like helicase